MNMDRKIFNKMLANDILYQIKRIMHHDHVALTLGMWRYFKLINVIHNFNKVIKYYDAYNRCRKSSLKIHSQKSGNVFEQSKVHMWQAHSKHHTQQWQDVRFSSQIGNKTRMPSPTLLFYMVLKVLATELWKKHK